MGNPESRTTTREGLGKSIQGCAAPRDKYLFEPGISGLNTPSQAPSLTASAFDIQSTMDFELLSDILTDYPPELQEDLLHNLPDRSLTHDGYSSTTIGREVFLASQSPNPAGAVISKIEDIFELIADSILNQEQEMVIHLKIRRKPSTQHPAPQNAAVKSLYEVRFPSKSPREAWKFSELPTTT